MYEVAALAEALKYSVQSDGLREISSSTQLLINSSAHPAYEYSCTLLPHAC
jgi:hypothetical protein